MASSFPPEHEPQSLGNAQILLPLPPAPLAINRGIGLQRALAEREVSASRQQRGLIVRAETEAWATRQLPRLIVQAETEVWATRQPG